MTAAPSPRPASAAAPVAAPPLARRAAAAALLAGGVVLACWLWRDWWALEFRRTEPWRAVLGWQGDAVAVLWCLFALLSGRAELVLKKTGERTDRRAAAERRRATGWAWLWVGATLSASADLGVTVSQAWADRRGDARAAAVPGRVLSAEVLGGDRRDDFEVRLTVRFPTPDGPFVGDTFVPFRLGADRKLSDPLAGWLGRTVRDLGVPPGPRPASRSGTTRNGRPGSGWTGAAGATGPPPGSC